MIADYLKHAFKHTKRKRYRKSQRLEKREREMERESERTKNEANILVLCFKIKKAKRKQQNKN